MIGLAKDKRPSGSYSVAFYLPQKYQDDTPKPTSKHVGVYKTKNRLAYVSSFRGSTTESKVLKVRLHRTTA